MGSNRGMENGSQYHDIHYASSFYVELTDPLIPELQKVRNVHKTELRT